MEYVEKEGKSKDGFGDTESDNRCAAATRVYTPGSRREDGSVVQRDPGIVCRVFRNSLTLKDESIQILKVREAGIAYILGHSYAKAKKSSHIFPKLAIDVVYSFLSRNCRGTNVVLNVPKSI